jgi:hypothetical protein
MPDEANHKQPQLDNIGDAETTTKNLITHVVTTLQSSATVRAADPPRLFFPGGIDKISVVVKLTPIDIEITISGAPASAEKQLNYVESSS